MLTIKNNEEVYSAPECMVISVKVQGMLCQSPVPGGAGGDDTIVDGGDMS